MIDNKIKCDIYENMNQALKVGKFVFKCKFENDAFLPQFKGSTFRGVFGRALQKISCGLAEKNCETCQIKSNCLYAKVFEQDEQSLKENNIFSASHPYIIEPVDNTRTRFQKGDYFIFNLILLGEYIFDISYFIYAIKEMGKVGIGKRNSEGNRAIFSVQEVLINDKQVYSDISQNVSNDVVKNEILKINKEFFNSKYPADEKEIMKVILETPLRFKINNSLTNTLDFYTLTRIILRRLNSLFKMYGDGDFSFYINKEFLYQESQKIEVLENNIKWEDKRRYSLRQKRSMYMGGLVGEVKYGGNITLFIPLLEAARILHLGKQTSFGLGKIDYIV